MNIIITLLRSFFNGNLRVKPVKYNKVDAYNYSSRISEDAKLLCNKDLSIRIACSLLLNIDLCNKKVIDIGCGEGRWSRFMNQMGAKVTAIDYNKYIISIAKKRSKDIDFIVLDIKDITKIKEKFDFAILCYSINNVMNIDKLFFDLNHILTSGSKVIIITKTLQILKYKNIFKRYFIKTITKNKFFIYLPGYDFNFYLSSARKNGFEVVDRFCNLSPDRFRDCTFKDFMKIYDCVMVLLKK